MNKRLLSITLIGWLFIAVGVVGFVFHASDFKVHGPLQYDLVLVCFLRVLAIICGVFILRPGNNWARWLLLVWIAYHVVLSGFHSLIQLLVHGVLLIVFAYFLLRPQASAHFRGTSTTSPASEAQ